MNAPSTARARARLELTNEIAATARRHLIDDGAAGLSLRAVARELGMASSAVYRYFPSRDALLTRLIIDAYNALADAAAERLSDVADDEPWTRLVALASGVRDWAIANPAEYALIYGTPVPGYAAPTDTIDPAIRITLLFLELAALIDATEPRGAGVEVVVTAELDAQLSLVRSTTAVDVSDDVLLRGLAIWCQLFGFVSFELFGTFRNVFEPADHLFEAQLRVMASTLGIPAEQ